MSATNPQSTGPSFDIEQQVGPVTGGEVQVVGVKIGTQVNVYVFGSAGAALPPPRPHAAPYKFLDSYTFDDRDIFFGRETFSTQMHDLILAHATTALIGRAAIGKSSLIHAGLVPALSRDGNIAAFSVRDYTAPVSAVRDWLQKTPNLALALPAEDSLAALVASFAAQTGRRVVIFFDQFERLFSLPLERQDEFARQVAATQSQDRGNLLHLVFVLRENFTEAAADLDRRVSDAHLLSNVQLVAGLDHEGARRAVAEPLHTGEGFDRADLDAELFDQFIWQELVRISNAGEKYIDPAPLQIICSRLYARAQADAGAGKQPKMSVALYKEMGQADGILQGFLSEQKTTLGVSDDEWGAIRRLLGAMAETDVLQPYRVSDLARLVGASEVKVRRWLEMLAERRLIEARE
jgi:hypothetical protein